MKIPYRRIREGNPMNRVISASAIVIVSLVLTSQVTAFSGISLLGESSQAAAATQDYDQVGGLSNATELPITSVVRNNETRPANFNLYNRDGQNFIGASDFSQVFSGSSMSRQNDAWVVQRPNGGRLSFIVQLGQMFLLFLGNRISTNVPAYEENGQTYVPLNTMGQFYGQQFNQNGSGLVSTNSQVGSEWLQESWANTLNQSGATEYENQITQASETGTNSGNPRVFRDITATVFSSSESNLRGAYGEWLRRDDLYVALPKRFSGTRPRVAVQGPNGTYTAEIKDVGPWNINDPYWETGSRPQAESGYDMGQTRSGRRRTNLAGIDLSYRLGELVGINGKGKVNWWFVQE